jgi:hypothetical protein
MVVLWRREVLAPLQTRLVDEVIRAFERQRTLYLSPEPCDDPDLVDTLIRVMESIVDLSVNELSIQFLDHTKFNREGVYQEFH